MGIKLSTQNAAEALIDRTGFDSPVTDRKDDHLNRWPLARQIFNAAANGPSDWATRVGVYGEWGTGKSSVLKFVESMAKLDSHFVIWFNPWSYSTKDELWHAFLKRVSDSLTGSLNGSPETATGSTTDGLESVREFFALSSAGALALQPDLGGKKVIILIDDLDRTSAELVPEILYALKEIMDVPGFSFICGFDPKVVGKVLKSRHKGFGNGLKFLEKIIDYPVWLPPPSEDGLKRIAEADAAKYCPFVPSLALHDALDLLPKNPRSIRQFVRLCALLKPQIERHGGDELNWPIILTSNVIKVRFPMLDSGMLHSHEFYRGISMLRGFDQSGKELEKVEKAIGSHAKKCLKEAGVKDSKRESGIWLHQAIKRICEQLNLWMGEGVAGIVYHATLVERPFALTKLEFENLLPLWKNKKSAPAVGEWVRAHAESQNFPISAVGSDLVVRLIQKFKDHLRDADGAFTEQARSSNRAQSRRIQSFLEELALRPSGFSKELRERNWLPVDPLISEMVKLADATGKVHQEMWPKIESMLLRLVEKWDARFEPLLDAVRAVGRYGRHWVEGRNSTTIARKLNESVDDDLSWQLINGIEEHDFVSRITHQHSGTREIRMLLRNPKSQLWLGHTEQLVAAFGKRAPSVAAQRNAFMLLEWVQWLLEDKEPGNGETGKLIAGNGELMQAIWRSSTYRPFLGRQACMIRHIPERAKALGVELEIPNWWRPALDEYLSSLSHGPEAKAEDPVDPQESNISQE